MDSEYAPYAKAGTGTVSGQAFLKTRGGDVKTAAGNSVFLLPMTSYSKEWMEQVVGAGNTLDPSPDDQKAAPFIRTKVADASGRFVFSSLPAGQYYVATKVTWEVPQVSGYGGYSSVSMSEQGGWISAKVQVEDGKNTEAIITR